MRPLQRYSSRDVLPTSLRVAGPAMAPPSAVFSLRTAAMGAAPRVVRACALLLDTWHHALSDLVRADDADTRAYWCLRLVPLLPPPECAFTQLGVATELAAALLGHDADARNAVTAGFLGPMLALRAAADAGTLSGDTPTMLHPSDVETDSSRTALRDATSEGCFRPIVTAAARLKALWAQRAVRALDTLSACERIGLLKGVENDATSPGAAAARPALRRMFDRGCGPPDAGGGGEFVCEHSDVGGGDYVLSAGALPSAAEPHAE